tara:strand:+ start:134 stop:355 length:222 start_codon:yes stop_codon:yes gene_type:complete
MGFINDIMNNDIGKVIISIIWGLGLATLFRKVCKGRKCLIMRGPKPEEMNNKVYKFDDKCYLYKAKNTTCKKK